MFPIKLNLHLANMNYHKTTYLRPSIVKMNIKNYQTQTIFSIAPYIFCPTIPTFFTKTTNTSSSDPHFIPFYTRI